MTEERIIEGQTAGSINEYNVYLALRKLKFDFEYQYALDGGRVVRGGQVIDFLVWTVPAATALYVQGQRWHSGSFGLEDQIKQAQAERHGFVVVEIWEDESMSPESALEAVKEKVY